MNHVTKQHGWVGRQFNRKEDYRLTTGKGQYFADIVVPGMLHLMFVRSAHAHARIKRIDTSATVSPIRNNNGLIAGASSFPAI